MSQLLSSVAVSTRSGGDAREIMQAYVATGPQMVQNHTPKAAPAAPAAQPAAAGPGGGMPGGGARAPPQRPGVSAAAAPPTAVVGEHEIFKNGKNALALFFYRQKTLDQNASDGPFWFSIQDDKIVAGTEDNYAVFEDVKPEILAAARQRGVLMLIEFENQQPYRCTPCYLSDSF
jgi:hypothetical protein